MCAESRRHHIWKSDSGTNFYYKIHSKTEKNRKENRDEELLPIIKLGFEARENIRLKNLMCSCIKVGKK